MAKKKAKKKGDTGASYKAEDITVLEGLDPVRKRPGMYIGTTGSEGLHHLIWEVFDNARDEAMADYADDIEIALLPNGGVRVADNGRGIPVDKHKQTKVSALETIMTTLHAGGKFGNKGYKVSGGLHGVGVSVVNALSSYAKAEVHRDGGMYVQEYKNGKRKSAVKKVKKSNQTGTIITFMPDEEVFTEMGWKWNKIITHMREQAYLIKGTRVSVIDAREYEGEIKENGEFFVRKMGLGVPSMTFYFEGGLKSMVDYLNKHLKPVHRNIFYIEKEVDDVEVEIALQYADDMSTRLLAFANNTRNPEGGMHVTGFKTALTRTINTYTKNNNLGKDADGNFAGDDVLEGLTAVVSVKMPEVQFEGQTKAKLGSVEARSATESVFGEAFAEFLEENPNDAKSIISKAVLALRARKAAKAAKDTVLRKGALEGGTLPGKLADCQTRSADEAEIFIVEGESAGGTAKMGRDRRTQAILPLRGKILNVERARLDKMLGNNEIKNLVIALGTGIGDTFDIENLRYHKIVIATDADVDGAHIRTLLLTLFYRYFKELIEAGYLYIAQPPLYKVKIGREEKHFFTEADKDAYLKKKGVDTNQAPSDDDEEEEDDEADEKKKKTKRKPSASIQRYKGLGEMNAEELWETTMDPERRILKRVTIEDAEEADRIFDTLMGTDVPARKSFIQSNAQAATIDI